MVLTWGAVRRRLGQAEVDDARRRLAIELDYQNVGRLQVAMHDGFLMCVLYSFTHLNEKVEPLANRELLLIAVFRDRQARHVLHGKVRLAIRSSPRVEYLRYRRMTHASQRLAL